MITRLGLALLLLAWPVIASAQQAQMTSDSEVYTLYRDSVLSPAFRIHVATFDAKDGRDYNRENCMIARDLFQRQEGVQVNYWCEPGRAKDVAP